MPSVSSVELTNTFDEWRQRTNDIVTIINAANSADPASAITFANSLGGFSINSVTTNSVTGTLVTGTRLTFTGGNVNFTSANVTSAGNVHQMHILGGTAIDVSLASLADTSISNTFIFNSKINLNGQKFIAGTDSEIDLTGATITNLGNVSAANLVGTGTTVSSQVKIVNPAITINQSHGSLTVSGTQSFSGATIQSAILDPYTARTGTVESSNVVANGAGFLATTNSVSLAVDAGTANVGIGKFTEVSTAIESEKRPTSSKGRLHIRTEFSAGSAAATAVEASADELVLEGNTAVGMTLLANNASNAHIMFGDTTDPDAGGILYNHATDSIHLSVASSTTASSNCAIFDNAFGGSLLIPNQASVLGVKGDLITNIAGKLHINVGASDATTGLYIDSNQEDRKAISVSASQTTMNVFQIDSDTLTEGSAIAIYDNSASPGGRNIFNIKQDHVDATGGTALHVETDGMRGAKIVQNKASSQALQVTSDTSHTTELVQIYDNGAGTTGHTLEILSDSTTSTQRTLQVANSSASMMTVVAGGGVGINDHTPSYKLDVNGDGRFVNDVYFNDDIFVASSIVHEGDTDTKISFTEDNMLFQTQGENKVLIGTAGVILYYDNNEKLATISNGVDITGQLQVDRVYPCYDNSTSIYFDYPTGNYGSVQINGGGAGGWQGFSIDGRAVFMHNGSNEFGLYDDVNNRWVLNHIMNGATNLYFDGASKIATSSAGAIITGTLTVSGSSVCANGIECRLRVLDESGNAINTC